jgi:hypothetical protein
VRRQRADDGLHIEVRVGAAREQPAERAVGLDCGFADFVLRVGD